MNVLKRKHIGLTSFILLVFCLMGGVVFFGDEIFNQFVSIATRLSIPTTAPRYNQLWSDVLSLAPESSILIEENKGSLRVADTPYSECIAGGGNLVYGTNEDLKTIVGKYAAKLNDLRWTISEGDSWLRADNENGTARILLAIPQILSDPESDLWDSYSTLFKVTVIFRDPKIRGCYG